MVMLWVTKSLSGCTVLSKQVNVMVRGVRSGLFGFTALVLMGILAGFDVLYSRRLLLGDMSDPFEFGIVPVDLNRE